VSDFQQGVIQDGIGTDFHPVDLLPRSFLNSTWSSFTFTRKEESKWDYHEEDHYGGRGGSGLFSVSLNKDHEENFNGDSVRDFTLSFDYKRVLIKRPWFSDILLKSRLWWFDGATQSNPRSGSSLSSGKTGDGQNSGFWPATPVEMIVTKNLRVTFDNVDEQTKTTLDKVSASWKWGFWIFSVSGGYSREDKTYDYSFKRDGNTFIMDAMQISAFVVDINPLLPNPDPSVVQYMNP